MSEITIRVKKRGVKLLGKVREYDEVLTGEEYNQLSLHVRNALLSSGTIEVVGDNTASEDVLTILNGLVTRMEAIEALLSTLKNSNDYIQIESSSANADSQAKAKKGDKVQFDQVDEENHGKFLIEGEVKQIRSGVATVIADDEEYKVQVEDLTVLSA